MYMCNIFIFTPSPTVLPELPVLFALLLPPSFSSSAEMLIRYIPPACHTCPILGASRSLSRAVSTSVSLGLVCKPPLKITDNAALSAYDRLLHPSRYDRGVPHKFS